MISYHHWDEEEENGNKWDWFYVTMCDLNTYDTLEEPWPVFAEGFDQAMNIYELLYKHAENQ